MDAAELYLDLLRGCLTRSLFQDEDVHDVGLSGWQSKIWEALKRYTSHPDVRLVRPVGADAAARRARVEGKGHQSEHFETSISHERLENIQHCITSVLHDGVPGDLIEAGVQRGGAAIFMRAVLAAHEIDDRAVWLADTFTGLPVPNPDEYPADAGYPQLTGNDPNAAGVDGVKTSFARYGLLDEQVRFIVGLFKDTLSSEPRGPLSVVRLDGDLYESTIDAIAALYPRLSIGGYLIVDDYNSPLWSKACGQAIRDYRAQHEIVEPMQEVDWNAIYWRRER